MESQIFQFRDPIHGFIEVTEDERKIIDSAPFQRLRNIRQLATTYLVYHGAEHTRFGHSLGVMHLVTRAFDSVVSKNPLLFCKNKKVNDVKIKWYRQILRLIALTHDLGHPPFSHSGEELFPDNLKHEDYTKKILMETEIRDYIDEIGKKFQKKYGASYKIDSELLWLIYEGKDVISERYITPDFLFLKSFMDGELDCDKMDYLLRDSLYCGVSYGKYDVERLISTLTAYKSKEENSLQLAVERGGAQVLEEFILARYFMFIQVYFHRTRRYLDKVLKENLSKILKKGKFPSDVNEYLKWDDNLVLTNLKKISDVKFTDRQIMTCVYESSFHSGKSEKFNARLIYDSLSQEYGDYLFYDEVDKEAHKLQPVLSGVKDDSGKGIPVVNEKIGEVQNIMEISLILKSLSVPISIQRIYVQKEKELIVRQEVSRQLNKQEN